MLLYLIDFWFTQDPIGSNWWCRYRAIFARILYIQL